MFHEMNHGQCFHPAIPGIDSQTEIIKKQLLFPAIRQLDDDPHGQSQP